MMVLFFLLTFFNIVPEPLDMSTWSIMKNIVADRGFSGLFTGKNPCFTESLNTIDRFKSPSTISF